MTYAEKLKDPRWQRKRLEVMQRDKFACQFCGVTDQTLHVHHIKYFPNRDPWDYPKINLVTLCDACHEAEHNIREGAEAALIEILKYHRFSAVDVLQLGNIITDRIAFKPGAGTEFIRSLE